MSLHLPDYGLLSFVLGKRFSAQTDGQKSEAHRAAPPRQGLALQRQVQPEMKCQGCAWTDGQFDGAIGPLAERTT